MRKYLQTKISQRNKQRNWRYFKTKNFVYAFMLLLKINYLNQGLRIFLFKTQCLNTANVSAYLLCSEMGREAEGILGRTSRT